MMNFIVYKLTFPYGIHIGGSKPNAYDTSETFIRSDTLYAAMTSVLAEVEGVTKDYIPEFTISSLFPYYTHNNKTSYFFPRPRFRLPFIFSRELIDYRKKIKSISWIDHLHFEKIINGTSFEISEIESSLKGSFLTTGEIPGNSIIEKNIRDRVVVPRDVSNINQPNPFVFEVLQFKGGSGLYFLVSGDSERRISKALSILQNRGLGTDRNLGLGHFEFETEELNIKVPHNSQIGITLGLILPDKPDTWSEWTKEISMKSGKRFKPGYSLIKRGGWITSERASHFRKGSVFMLEEGSVLNIKDSYNKEPIVLGNSNISLRPKSIDWVDLPPVLRCGKSIVIPTKLPGNV